MFSLITSHFRNTHENRRKRIIKSGNSAKPKYEERDNQVNEVFSRSEPIAGPSRQYHRDDNNRAEGRTIVRSSRKPYGRIEDNSKTLPIQR